MRMEADDKYPNETGGIFFGYWSDPREAVVSRVIGPGPEARHSPCSFEPDSDYQEFELSILYEKSGRLHSYLGDWHTHPTGPALLSTLDRETASTIAHYGEARAPFPLMGVMTWFDAWKLRVWCRSRLKLRPGHHRYRELKVHLYEPSEIIDKSAQ